MGGGALEALVLVEEVKGVPLRLRAWPKDAQPTESRIVRAVPKQFPAQRFEPPPDYGRGLGVRLRR
jgi:hypothetical protein